MAEMTTKEFWTRTGITEGYGAEILKNAEHKAWHMPQGAKWPDEATEEPDTDEHIDELIDDTDSDKGTQDPEGDEGGSVEGEPKE